MRKIDKIGAQGDVLFRRVDKLPAGYKPTENKIVAHSETGHNHVAVGNFQRYEKPDDGMLSYMVSTEPIRVDHLRAWDTHEALELLADGGETIWEIRRQREWTPEGWRRVED